MQSTTEPFPTASSPNSSPNLGSSAKAQDAAPTVAPNNTPNNSDFARINTGAANGTGTNMYRTFSVSPPVIGSPVSRHNSLPDSGSDEARENPYVDPREITKVSWHSLVPS